MNQVPVFENFVLKADEDEDDEIGRSSSMGDLTTLDFSKMEDLTGKIRNILKEKPLFLPKKDFRELLFATYKHWAKTHAKVLFWTHPVITMKCSVGHDLLIKLRVQNI